MKFYAYRTDDQGNCEREADKPVAFGKLLWRQYDIMSCYAYLTPRQASIARKAGGQFYVYDNLGFLTSAYVETLNGEPVLMAFGHAEGEFIGRRI